MDVPWFHPVLHARMLPSWGPTRCDPSQRVWSMCFVDPNASEDPTPSFLVGTCFPRMDPSNLPLSKTKGESSRPRDPFRRFFHSPWRTPSSTVSATILGLSFPLLCPSGTPTFPRAFVGSMDRRGRPPSLVPGTLLPSVVKRSCITTAPTKQRQVELAAADCVTKTCHTST